jgi:hypothetical protein
MDNVNAASVAPILAGADAVQGPVGVGGLGPGPREV